MNDITINYPTEFQGVTLWLGDDNPVTIGDDTDLRDIPEYISGPIQRAVTIARLNCIVAALEGAPE